MINKNNHSGWINLCRSVAAFLVCFGHTRNAFLVDYSEIKIHEWWHAGLYFFSGLGHQSVIIFFVLSGYLVGGGVLKERENFSWKKYFTSRLVRLWVVLIPALIFTYLVDLYTVKIYADAYNGDMANIWNSGPRGDYSISLKTFLLNIFFLQTVGGPVFGSNGPLWSLANEFWYYMLFPCICYGVGFFGTRNIWIRLQSIVAAIFIISLMPAEMRYGFILWVFGALCWIFQSKSIEKVRFWHIVGSIILLSLSLIYSKSEIIKHYAGVDPDIAVAICFAGMLIILLKTDYRLINNKFTGNVINFFSNISYTLYLFHFPVLCAIAIIFIGKNKMQPTYNSILIVMLADGIIILLSSMLWWIFERNTEKIKNWQFMLRQKYLNY